MSVIDSRAPVEYGQRPCKKSLEGVSELFPTTSPVRVSFSQNEGLTGTDRGKVVSGLGFRYPWQGCVIVNNGNRRALSTLQWETRSLDRPETPDAGRARDLPSTSAFLEERERLPRNQRAAFDELVSYYRYYATVHHKQPFVSYKVLADLIREGWRMKKGI